MSSAAATILFGAILGIRHAFEADHLIAVSNMVAMNKNPWKAAVIGAFWGIGHTTTLFIIGLIVLLLNITIPVKISSLFETLVGFMLVFLGIQSVIKGRTHIHSHEHAHDGVEHSHLHVSHDHLHRKSFLVGTVHGLAGSGALMLLVLTTIQSTLQGIVYILLFGIGSILGMTLMSVLVGLPLIFSVRRFEKLEKIIRLLAGTIGILYGIFIIAKLGPQAYRLFKP